MPTWTWAKTSAEAKTAKGGSYKPHYDPKTGRQIGWDVYAEGEEPDVEVAPEAVPEGTPSPSPDWTPYGPVSPREGIELLHGIAGQGSGFGSGGGGGGGGGGSRGGGSSRAASVGPQAAGRSSSTAAGGPAVGKAKLLELIQQFQSGAQQAGRGFGDVYQGMLGAVSSDTGQRAADIRQAYREQAARQQAGLQRLGLGGTTVAPTMRMGLARERGAALNRLTDEILRTKSTAPMSSSSAQKVSGVIGGGGQFYGPSGGVSSFGRRY